MKLGSAAPARSNLTGGRVAPADTGFSEAGNCTLALCTATVSPTLTPPPLLLLQERKGSPLFMPLMNERGVEAVTVGTKGPDANAV